MVPPPEERHKKWSSRLSESIQPVDKISDRSNKYQPRTVNNSIGGASSSGLLCCGKWLAKNGTSVVAELLDTKMFTSAFYVPLSGNNEWVLNLITICFTTL